MLAIIDQDFFIVSVMEQSSQSLPTIINVNQEEILAENIRAVDPIIPASAAAGGGGGSQPTNQPTVGADPTSLPPKYPKKKEAKWVYNFLYKIPCQPKLV